MICLNAFLAVQYDGDHHAGIDEKRDCSLRPDCMYEFLQSVGSQLPECSARFLPESSCGPGKKIYLCVVIVKPSVISA
jgi:hypothetical protein